MEENRNRRPYRSSRRREQAQATRRAILQGAQRLFVAGGYANTTIRAIAAEAGVAEPTVYAVFRDKPSIVWAIAESILAGDEGGPTAESAAVQSIRAERTFEGRLWQLVQWTVGTFEGGLGDLQRVVTEASVTDARLRQLVEEADDQRRQDDRLIVGLLAEVAEPSFDENLDELGDFLGALAGPEVYDLLVKKYGWSAEQYSSWLTRLIRRMFEQPAATQPLPRG